MSSAAVLVFLVCVCSIAATASIIRLFGSLLCLCAAVSAFLSQAVSAESPDKVLTVATRHVPPFAIRQEDGTWAGVSIDLWNSVSTELGWRTEFVDLGLKAMLEAVAQGEVDAAAGALSITSQREVVMDFSHPFVTSGLAIAVPRDAGGAWLKVLQRLFSGPFLGVVGVLGGVLLAVGVLIWLLERRRNAQFGGTTVVKQEFAESLVVLPSTFQRQDYGIALPSGSPLRESLNRELLRHLQGPAWRATLLRYIGSE